jgi:hypothetical protein
MHQIEKSFIVNDSGFDGLIVFMVSWSSKLQKNKNFKTKIIDFVKTDLSAIPHTSLVRQPNKNFARV